MPPANGTLPARYQEYWGTEFWAYVDSALGEAEEVLDVGSGRQPSIPRAKRPDNLHYVGLDISRSELDAAPAGSYDEAIVADARTVVPELTDRFDLIVSWQVLEHVSDLPSAADAFYRYAREGGWLVACLSGKYAVFAVTNRLLPTALGRRLVARLRRRPLETVFPAYYDHCDEAGLRRAFSKWENLDVVPLWRGADYFERLPGLRGLYIRYENWAIRRGHNALATHYVVAARKGEAAT